MKSKLEIIPRYAETDKMGIIHHSTYLLWYECGRNNFCEEVLKIPYKKIEDKGISLAVINVSVNYKHPAFFEDKLIINTWIETYTKVKIQFAYEIYNQNKILINLGSTTHAWVDSKLRPINIAKREHQIYQSILNSIK